MKLVVVESPYAGDIAGNEAYARACIRDCLLRGESPIASHLLYTQPGVLRDNVHGERELGLAAGWAWMRAADLVAVYTDRGISGGMERGIGAAEQIGLPIERRALGGEWAQEGAA